MAAIAPDPLVAEPALVTTSWVADHLADPHVVVVEVSGDPAVYRAGHLAGAVNWSARSLLTAPIERPQRFRASMERLLGSAGIDNYATVVIYGDASDPAAAGAAWRLALCGHRDVRLMDGGRRRWIAEQRPLSAATPARVHAAYKASPADDRWRASRRDLTRRPDGCVVVDAGVRPGALNDARHIPWVSLVGTDGGFKPAGTLESVFAARGVTRAHHVITWSEEGGESAHAWFALARILGYPRVRNREGA